MVHSRANIGSLDTVVGKVAPIMCAPQKAQHDRVHFDAGSGFCCPDLELRESTDAYVEIHMLSSYAIHTGDRQCIWEDGMFKILPV